MYRAKENIKLDELIVALPGLVIGFNETILPGIEAMRKAAGLEKAKFFIETWNTPENIEWVESIYKYTSEYPNIDIIINTWRFEDIDFPKHWKYICDSLDIDTGDSLNIQQNLFKRLIPFIIFQKMYDRIYTYKTYYTEAQDLVGYKNIPVIRIKPNFIFNSPEEIESSFMSSMIIDLSRQFIQYTPFAFGDLKNPFDIIYTDHITSHSVSDIFYYSSPNTLYRVFGSTTEEAVNKFIKLTKKYLDRLPYEVKDTRTLGTVGLDQEKYALEASVLFKDYIDLQDETVSYGLGDQLRFKISRATIDIKNPRYEIKDGEILVTSPAELGQTDTTRLFTLEKYRTL